MTKKRRYGTKKTWTRLIAVAGFLGMGIVLVLVAWQINSTSRVGFIPAGASNASQFTINTLDKFSRVVKVSEFRYPPEITPHQIISNGKLTYYLPGSATLECNYDQKITDGDVLIPFSKCKEILKPGYLKYHNPSTGEPVWQEPDKIIQKDWNYMYDGVLGVAEIPYSSQAGSKKRLLAIRHGEHFNAKYGYNYQGRIFPKLNVSQCAAGYDANGKYNMCWESYSQFVTLAYKDEGSSEWKDLGPIVWPAAGYMHPDGSRGGLRGGFYQPTLFVKNPYVYVFYRNSYYTNPYWTCYSVARAPISQGGRPDSWVNYYNGKWDSPALPSGFPKPEALDSNPILVRNFYKKPGGKASCIGIDQPSDSPYYFSVAKVKNTPYYIAAIESGPEEKRWKLGIRISTDLLNWSSEYLLLSSDKKWGDGGNAMSYPYFLNKDGTSNYEIDADEFYLMGKNATGASTGYELNIMKLQLLKSDIISPTPNPTTLTKEELFALQHFKILLNRTPQINNSGLQWHAKYIKSKGRQADLKNIITTEEFVNQTKNMTNTQYVELLYKAVLSRNPDKDAQWWVNNLDAGKMTRVSIVDEMYKGWEPDWVYKTGKLYKP